MSGKDPEEYLTDDGESILVAGMRWYTKEDSFSLYLNISSHSKKKRGQMKMGQGKDASGKFSRRESVSHVAEIFDLVGMMTPIVATLKVYLHELVTRRWIGTTCCPTNYNSCGNLIFSISTKSRMLSIRGLLSRLTR